MKRPAPIYLYVAAIAVPGVALFATTIIPGIEPEPHGFDTHLLSSVQFWLLASAVFAGEFVGVSVAHRRETLRVTIGDPFTLSILFTFGLPAAMVVKAIASILEDGRRKQPWWKVLFNVGQFSLSLATGSWFVTLLGYPQGLPDSLEAWHVAIAIAGGVAYFVVNTTIVTTAIALAVGNSPVTALRTNVRERVLQYGALLGFSPVVNAAIHESAALFPLLLIPMAIVYYSGQVSQKHIVLAQQLGELYETTRMTSARVDTRESIRELLERVCNMFNAGGAAIIFFASEGDDTPHETSVNLDKATFTYEEPTVLDPTKGLWARAASENKALMLPSPITNDALREYYEGLEIKDVMIAPMNAEDGANGVIRVFNRQTQTFTAEDLRLFETLANHVSVAMQNARLIAQLEESLAHLTEMNRLKDDFVASVSHELRTPLTSIQGFVKTLLRPDANFSEADQRSFLETVDRQSTRLHRLIEDLLAVSRIESKTDSTHYAVISLKQLANDVVAEVHNRVVEGQIELDFDGDLPVETDGGKVHQIMSNLLDNALKYGAKGETVVIRGRREGEGASIAVIDKGSGVPADMQDKVFDRFYQVDQTATRAVGGAGLGLYICRRMAEAIGGRIWLEKTGPDGSTFMLWVPSAPMGVVDPSLTAAAPEGTWKL